MLIECYFNASSVNSQPLTHTIEKPYAFYFRQEIPDYQCDADEDNNRDSKQAKGSG